MTQQKLFDFKKRLSDSATVHRSEDFLPFCSCPSTKHYLLISTDFHVPYGLCSSFLSLTDWMVMWGFIPLNDNIYNSSIISPVMSIGHIKLFNEHLPVDSAKRPFCCFCGAPSTQREPRLHVGSLCELCQVFQAGYH